MPADISTTAERIKNAIVRHDDELTKELVERYLTDPDSIGSGFAGTTFDQLGDPSGPGFTPDDLVAASLLDVRVKPAAVRALLMTRADEFRSLVDAIPSDVEIWEATDADFDAATACWEKLRELPGIDWVIAGKLLARKRPRLVPVYDSVVRRQLGLSEGDPVWEGLRVALGAEELRTTVDGWRPTDHEAAANLSTLRILDIALWMRGSSSRAAKQARGDA